MKNKIQIAFSVLVLSVAGSAHAAAKKTPSLPKLPAPVKAPPATEVHTVVVPASTPSVDEHVIYDGLPGAQSGLSLSTWGGGAVEDSGEIGYGKGGHAVKITTYGLYQGATGPSIRRSDHPVSGSPSNAFVGRFHDWVPPTERGGPDNEIEVASANQATLSAPSGLNNCGAGRSSCWPAPSV